MAKTAKNKPPIIPKPPTIPKPTPGLKKADYQYALEVANQPATSAKQKQYKLQARVDKKYLEQKFPSLKRKKK